MKIVSCVCGAPRRFEKIRSFLDICCILQSSSNYQKRNKKRLNKYTRSGMEQGPRQYKGTLLVLTRAH